MSTAAAASAAAAAAAAATTTNQHAYNNNTLDSHTCHAFLTCLLSAEQFMYTARVELTVETAIGLYKLSQRYVPGCNYTMGSLIIHRYGIRFEVIPLMSLCRNFIQSHGTSFGCIAGS